MAQVVEHDLVSPAELSVADFAIELAIARSSVPVDTADDSVTWL
jgi:hypothetical protein